MPEKILGWFFFFFILQCLNRFSNSRFFTFSYLLSPSYFFFFCYFIFLSLKLCSCKKKKKEILFLFPLFFFFFFLPNKCYYNSALDLIQICTLFSFFVSPLDLCAPTRLLILFRFSEKSKNTTFESTKFNATRKVRKVFSKKF